MPCAWDRLQLFLLARLQLFLLVNGGVDLRGDHTLLATGGETSDLKRQKYIEQDIMEAISNGAGRYIC